MNDAALTLNHATFAPPELVLPDGLLVEPLEEWQALGLGWDDEAAERRCEPGVCGCFEQARTCRGGGYVFAIDAADLPVWPDNPRTMPSRIFSVDVPAERITLVHRRAPARPGPGGAAPSSR